MARNAELLDPIELDKMIRRKLTLHGALYRTKSRGEHACRIPGRLTQKMMALRQNLGDRSFEIARSLIGEETWPSRLTSARRSGLE